MTQTIHHLLLAWMQFVLDYGYLGVLVLMAFESTALPVPAEVVNPPAAFWAAQGKLNIWLVVVAATAGSWIGSALSYWIALKLGRPLVERYGKYLLLPPAKIAKAYGLDTLYGMGFKGQGVKLGVTIGALFKFKDLQSFWQSFGIFRNNPTVVQTMEPYVSRYIEGTLDVEWSGAMAPWSGAWSPRST